MVLHYVAKRTAPAVGAPDARDANASASASANAPPALLLLLHGTGADEHNLLPLVQRIAPRDFLAVSLRAPLAAPWGGYRWFEGFSADPAPTALRRDIAASCDAVLSFIADAPASLGAIRSGVAHPASDKSPSASAVFAPRLAGTDPGRVYVVGFSQGATIVWATLLSRWTSPGCIRGAVAISGRLMPDAVAPHTPLGARLAPASQLDSTRVFASHGVLDEVTPLGIGLQNLEHFAAWQGGGEASRAERLAWHEYEDDGHEIGPEAVRDVAIFLEECEASAEQGSRGASVL